MRDVDLRDLIGREEVKLDKSDIEKYIKNKVVLVTGEWWFHRIRVMQTNCKI